MLSQLELKTGVQSRTDSLEAAIGCGAGIVEANEKIGSPLETLGVGEIGGGCSLQRSGKRTSGNEIGVIALERAGEYRVKAGNERAEKAPGGRAYQTASPGARAARAESGSPRAGSDLGADSTYAAPGRILHNAEWHTQDGSARLGTQYIGVSNVQVIASDGDVEIILERQRDRVIQRKVQLAIVHKLVDASRVREIWRLNGAGRCGAGALARVFTHAKDVLILVRSV